LVGGDDPATQVRFSLYQNDLFADLGGLDSRGHTRDATADNQRFRLNLVAGTGDRFELSHVLSPYVKIIWWSVDLLMGKRGSICTFFTVRFILLLKD
jgi:hypothetical protein